jgi:hypothetical protein
LIIERSTDYDALRSIMTNPEIWDTITNDGCDVETWQPEQDRMYLLGSIEGEYVGVFVIHMSDIGIYQCHVQVLPSMRKLYAIEFGKMVINWVWKNTEINKLFALIPDIYPNVKNFSELHGFHQEGLITKSFIKNGSLCSQWLMTIERGD